MVDLDIIEQRPVTLAELKEKLDVAKKDKELNFRAAKVYGYLTDFVEHDLTKIDELHAKLNALGIQKLRDRHIVKILDLMPKDPEILKGLFAGESVSFKSEELKQIIDVING